MHPCNNIIKIQVPGCLPKYMTAGLFQLPPFTIFPSPISTILAHDTMPHFILPLLPQHSSVHHWFSPSSAPLPMKNIWPDLSTWGYTWPSSQGWMRPSCGLNKILEGIPEALRKCCWTCDAFFSRSHVAAWSLLNLVRPQEGWTFSKAFLGKRLCVVESPAEVEEVEPERKTVHVRNIWNIWNQTIQSI